MEKFQNVLAWVFSKFNHPQNNIYDASDKRSAISVAFNLIKC